MFLIRGRSGNLSQGWTRRDVLLVGLGGALGLNLSSVSARTQPRQSKNGSGQAKSCILIYLFGGPSHIDIWDMKPAAPDGIRGEFKPIATNVPGIQICEHLPRLARLADRYAIIRSLSHGDSAHGSAGHAMLTGRLPRIRGEVGPTADDFPHYGAILSRIRPVPQAIAPFVALPWTISTSTNTVPGQTGSFLGRSADPLRLELPDEHRLRFLPPLAELPEGVDRQRLLQRQMLHEQMEPIGRLGSNLVASDMGKLYDRAFHFMGSPEARVAFDLEREPASVRERYGQHVFGQSLLLARRLVEAGVPMITVYWPDRKEPEAFINNGVRDSVAVPAWDTHGRHVGNTPNFPTLREKLLPPLDQSSSALLEDLEARGLLGQTLVAWTGEFGRSPHINRDAGRDHYGNVFSAMLAGGGIRGGQVYGSSDKQGAYPSDNPVSPGAFAATLYHCLGVPPETEIPDRLGRPIRIADGAPIAALLG